MFCHQNLQNFKYQIVTKMALTKRRNTGFLLSSWNDGHPARHQDLCLDQLTNKLFSRHVLVNLKMSTWKRDRQLNPWTSSVIKQHPVRASGNRSRKVISATEKRSNQQSLTRTGTYCMTCWSSWLGSSPTSPRLAEDYFNETGSDTFMWWCDPPRTRLWTWITPPLLCWPVCLPCLHV